MPDFRSLATPYARELVRAVASDRLIYVSLIAYLAAGALYVALHRGMLMGALDIYLHTCFLTYCLIMPAIIAIFGIAHITHRIDRRRSLAYRHMFRPRRVARFIAGTALMMLVLAPFEAMFASIKSTIAESGFPYDKIAADVDKAIHFGHAPVKWLMSFAKHEWLLRIVEFNYNTLWFVLCFGVLYWVAISPRADGLRLRYWAAFFFVWVLVGNVAACLFPTAGPAFYGLVTGDMERFGRLTTFVGTTAGWFSSAADEQQYLWWLHAHAESGFGSGISAFPSMHVALVALNAMFLGERGRKLGIAAWVYVAFVLASSTYLGWHYAIDGYAALAMTVAIYWAVRQGLPLLRRLDAWRPVIGRPDPVGADIVAGEPG